MGIQYQDSTGAIIAAPSPVASPDQQVADSVGNLVNPSTEETVASIDAKFNSLGQKTSAASTPIVLASDQSPISITSTISLGVAEHHNGTATSTPATVSFSGTSQSILISNIDLLTAMLVSFDGDSNTFTIVKGQNLSIDAAHASVRVSTSSGTANYQMLVVV